jgi:hypothetical protein
VEAENVVLYGGLEADVHEHLRSRYIAVTPFEENRDLAEVRFFAAYSSDDTWDCIAIGHNGSEVALKTISRILDITKSAGGEAERSKVMPPAKQRLRVYLSSASPRTEYLVFFKKHGIRNPDVVAVGFMSDASFVLSEMGFPRPQTFSDESLRALWYPNVHGKKVLLISINGNRIFGSRIGELIEATFEIAPDSRPLMMFFGSAGAIDAPDLIGQILAPKSVMIADSVLPATHGAPVHLVRNRAVDLVRTQSIHVSVESVLVETIEWVKNVKRQRINSVDQELYHFIDAIHASARSTETDIYAAVLVTDNAGMSSPKSKGTLETAEDTIAETAAQRQNFIFDVFQRAGLSDGQRVGDTEAARAINVSRYMK